MAAWKRLMARFDALAPRERVLVSLAVWGATVALVWAVFVDPAALQRQGAVRTIAQQQVQLTTLKAQVAALQAPGRSPEDQALAEREAKKKKKEEMGGSLAAMERALVPPQRMVGLLESMIGGRSGLRLVGLRTLPVAPVLENKEGGKGKA